MRGALSAMLAALTVTVMSGAVWAQAAAAPAADERARAAEILRSLPDLKGVEVAVPWKDFKALMEKMIAPAKLKPKPKPPVNYVLGPAAFKATVANTTARLTATLDLVILREEGYVTVPLVGTAVALGATKLDGKPAVVITRSNRYYLVASGAGQHVIELTAAVKVEEDRGTRRFRLRLPQTAGARLEVTVPDKDADVTVSPAAETVSKAGEDAVVVTASLPVTDSVTVQWQRRLPEAERGVAKVYAQVGTLISVGEGFLRSYNRVQYQILHAKVDHFRLALPKGVTVLDVTGDGVRDWKKAVEDGQDILKVALNYPATGAYRLAVTFESAYDALGEAPVVAVPVMRVLDVEREKGFVGVAAEANVEVASAETEDARVVDVKELPGSVAAMAATPLLLGYRYAKQPYRVALEIRRHEDVAVLTTVIDSMTATTMQTEAGRRITRLRLMVRNNQRQFLKLRMPENVQVWSAFVGSRAVSPGRDGDGRLLLPLEKSARQDDQLKAFALELVYVEEADPIPAVGEGVFQAALPAIDVPATVALWNVYLPEGRTFRDFTGTIARLEEDKEPVSGRPAAAVRAERAAATKTVRRQTDQQARQLRAQQLAVLRRGAMPIRIAVPERGQLVQFQKLLVSNETLNIEATWMGKRVRKGWFGF